MGLDFPEGGSVKADRRGRVTVSDEQAAAIRGSAAMRRYDAIVELAPMRPSSVRPRGVICECGVALWSWQDHCPKCGHEVVK